MTQPPARSGREKPRRGRVKTDFWCDVSGSKNTAHVHVRNLTLDGCRLLSPCAFPKGDVVDLAIPVSEHEPDLKLQAQIRWLGLNPDEGPFVLGCRFIHSQESADRSKKLRRSGLKKAPKTAGQGGAGGAAEAGIAQPGVRERGARPPAQAGSFCSSSRITWSASRGLRAFVIATRISSYCSSFAIPASVRMCFWTALRGMTSRMMRRAGWLSADWNGMPAGAIASAARASSMPSTLACGIATPCSMPVDATFSRATSAS